MAERIARTRAGHEQPVDDPASLRPPRKIRPCWVRDADDPRGHHPALLLDWRQDPTGVWMGRVCHQLLADDGWIVAEEWLPGDRLRPA
ncbi:hypothetical protein [Nocardioides nanhaiensis]